MRTMRSKRQSRGEQTVRRTIRMPVSLDDRINVLAIKSLTSYSSWIIKALEQKAYKHRNNRPNIDSSASGEG